MELDPPSALPLLPHTLRWRQANPSFPHFLYLPLLVRSRLYRNATIAWRGWPHVKSLRHLGRDLRRTVIVDNSPYAMAADPYNAYLIPNFYSDPNDRELDRLYEHIERMTKLQDVRPYLHRQFDFPSVLNNIMGE